jgi:hypothetical protein
LIDVDKRLEMSSFDRDERGALEALGVRPGSFGTDTPCPDPSMLLAAEEGVLDEAAATEVRAHIAACPACTMLAADLSVVFEQGDVSAAEEAVRARVIGRRERGGHGWMWGWSTVGLVAAASLVTAVVLTRPVAFPGVSDPRAGATATRLPTLPSVFYAEPRADLGDVELTLRGEPSSELVIGVGSGETADEVSWREAVALVDVGDVTAARPRLEALCAHPTLHGALACAGLAELDRTHKR